MLSTLAITRMRNKTDSRASSELFPAGSGANAVSRSWLRRISLADANRGLVPTEEGNEWDSAKPSAGDESARASMGLRLVSSTMNGGRSLLMPEALIYPAFLCVP